MTVTPSDESTVWVQVPLLADTVAAWASNPPSERILAKTNTGIPRKTVRGIKPFCGLYKLRALILRESAFRSPGKNLLGLKDSPGRPKPLKRSLPNARKFI
jgi:hypothetical protein